MDGVGVRRLPAALLELARAALLEDVGRGDVTTSQATVGEEARARARFLAREELIVSGMEAARAVFFEAGGEEVESTAFTREGDLAPAGSVLAEAKGSARLIFTAERVALNLVMRISLVFPIEQSGRGILY